MDFELAGRMQFASIESLENSERLLDGRVLSAFAGMCDQKKLQSEVYFHRCDEMCVCVHCCLAFTSHARRARDHRAGGRL